VRSGTSRRLRSGGCAMMRLRRGGVASTRGRGIVH
jgi:hypothetical protein